MIDSIKKKNLKEERPIKPPPAPYKHYTDQGNLIREITWEEAWKEGYKKGFDEGYKEGWLERAEC